MKCRFYSPRERLLLGITSGNSKLSRKREVFALSEAFLGVFPVSCGETSNRIRIFFITGKQSLFSFSATTDAGRIAKPFCLKTDLQNSVHPAQDRTLNASSSSARAAAVHLLSLPSQHLTEQTSGTATCTGTIINLHKQKTYTLNSRNC